MKTKTILITGSSTGIGRATAIYFQSKGWNVVASMRNPEKETELTRLKNVLVVKLDVCNQDSINQAINKSIKHFNTIDVVLNNAGYALGGTFESASKEQILNQFNVNVFGLFAVTQAVLPHFRKNKNGMFINISSQGGKVTFPMLSLYHATKYAIEGFSESLCYELEPLNIKVKLVEPGAIDTHFAKNLEWIHNNELQEYNKIVENVQEGYSQMTNPKNTSSAAYVSSVIYKTATEQSNSLRYVAGQDAETILEKRKHVSDRDFINAIKKMFNI